jgi:hypothetical protein
LGVTAATGAAGPGMRTRTWPRLGIVEGSLLAAFVVAAFSVFLAQAVDAAVNNRVFIGADGLWAQDQLQYLAWATDAGHHGLIANLLAFHLGSHVFLDPFELLSGFLHVHLGMSYVLLQACWKAAAVLALFALMRAYARSILGADNRAVLVAMLIALFMLPPTYFIASRLGLYGVRLIGLESFSAFWINGYFPIALAVAAMIGFLMQVDTLLSNGGTLRASDPRATLIACAAGLAASWLHPWQGMTLIVIVIGLVVWERPSWRRHARLLAPVLATAAPLAYYAVLPHVDAGWAQSQSHTAHNWTRSGDLAILIILLPIAVLAAPGYVGRASTPRDRMLRLWPVAILAVFIIVPSDKFHALAGWSIPAALFMVRAWPWYRRRVPRWSHGWATTLAVAGVCLAVAAAPIELAYHTVDFRGGSQHAAEIARDDARALDRIAASPVSGGVLTTAELGHWVPAITDHTTWVGHPTWTPSYGTRGAQVAALFSGSSDSDPARERAFVRSTGATFVLEPCQYRGRLEPALLPAGFTVVGIGCATLYSRR